MSVIIIISYTELQKPSLFCLTQPLELGSQATLKKSSALPFASPLHPKGLQFSLIYTLITTCGQKQNPRSENLHSPSGTDRQDYLKLQFSAISQ